ncbi:MAG TPA: ABC transporter ATP-binding protein [Tepidisphaeraceae bacterium]|nr:ABC transporter ATP-binding protein [Tepidisphaeraceae bacterium]
MPDASLAINLTNVEKVYRGKVYALRGVNMRVNRGEVFGLLGPNGAGKSTLVKIMMTVVKPTHCQGQLLGEEVGHKATLARVGYLPENHRFPRYMTGRQILDFFGALSQTPRTKRKARIDELLETVGMTSWADKKISIYSKGMMQRVGLAQALIHDPDLILLDEPTDGVDPVGRREIRDVLLSLKRKGKTIFINSHLLSELELICDRVAILIGGKVAKQGTIDELAIARQHYYLDLSQAPDPAILESIRRCLPEGITLAANHSSLQILTTDAAHVQPVIDLLRSAQIVIKRVHPVRPSLEELFIEAVGHSSAVGAKPGAQP